MLKSEKSRMESRMENRQNGIPFCADRKDFHSGSLFKNNRLKAERKNGKQNGKCHFTVWKFTFRNKMLQAERKNGKSCPPSGRGSRSSEDPPSLVGESRAGVVHSQSQNLSTNHSNLEVPMKHDIWNFAGQLYARLGTRPHRRQDGTSTVLTVWLTHCAKCGVLFEVMTPEEIPKYLTRRCAEHRRTGCKVKQHVHWGKRIPLADLLGKRPTQTKKTDGGAVLGGTRRRPDHTNPQEERYGC